MKVFVLQGIANIEDHWKIKTLVDVFSNPEAAEAARKVLEHKLPPETDASGRRHYWHDEEIYAYEIEERELIGELFYDEETKK